MKGRRFDIFLTAVMSLSRPLIVFSPSCFVILPYCYKSRAEQNRNSIESSAVLKKPNTTRSLDQYEANCDAGNQLAVSLLKLLEIIWIVNFDFAANFNCVFSRVMSSLTSGCCCRLHCNPTLS